MKCSFSFLLLALLLGCSSSSRVQPNSAEGISLYTDVKGPSKESGDCGGYAFFLKKEGDQFQSGDVAEFEGGCRIYKRSITELKHDAKTGRISLLALSSGPGQLVSFEGKLQKGRLVGIIKNVDEKTKKPVSPHFSKIPRIFEAADANEFLRAHN